MKSLLTITRPLFGRRTILLSMLAPILFVACRPSVDHDDLIGTYQASYDSGTQTLVIAADGSYVQTVAVRGSDPVTNEGTWTWDESNDSVTLFGCGKVRDFDTGDIRQQFSQQPLGCTYSLEHRFAWFGQLRLVIGDSDILKKID